MPPGLAEPLRPGPAHHGLVAEIKEITWVYEAVHVAENVAKKVGWEAVPWEQLVEEVLSVTDPTG